MKTEFKDVIKLYLGCECETPKGIQNLVSISLLGEKNNVLTLEGGKSITNAFNYDEIKPILRPLSDLVKEVEINGEKFIPLKKLHELLETNGKYSLSFVDRVSSIEHKTYKHHPDDFILKYVVPTTNMGDLVYSLTYAPDLRRFIVRDETNRRPLGIAYQLDLFLKLLEWKFDLFGLIESGQAIDVTILK